MSARAVPHTELLCVTPEADKLIEQAGRLCHRSAVVDAQARNAFIMRLIRMGHESVLEHASATFLFCGSRAFTHQLVRHRLCSFSQVSQRYVKHGGFDYMAPATVKTRAQLHIFRKAMETAQDHYKLLAEMGVKLEDARFVLPNACLSEIIVTANIRQWRKMFELRCSKHAQWEIRERMIEALDHLQRNESTAVLFGDFEVDPETKTAVLVRPYK